MSLFDRIKRAMSADSRNTDEAGDRLHVYRRMMKMIEIQVPTLAGHYRRVSRYAELIAQELGLPDNQVGEIRMAGELHDIGETRVHGSILAQQQELTFRQIELIRQHPVTGAEMLQEIPSLRSLAPMVRHHHERWDGSGYPDGLSGDDIPLGARIIAVADVFDALTSERPYRRAYSAADTVHYLKQHAGELYDPEVVAALVAQWENDSSVDELVEEGRQYVQRRTIPQGTAVSQNSIAMQLTRLKLDLPDEEVDD